MKVRSIVPPTLVLCIDALLMESVTGLAMLPRTSTAFSQPKCQSRTIRRDSQLWATVPQQKDDVSVESPPQSMLEGHGSSKEKIANELSLGKTLDGGPVIDFGAVKDDKSRAEMALSAARKKYEASLKEGVKGDSQHPSRQRLMGINDEVVAEVGYEIGEFMKEFAEESGTDADVLVQKCGTYLRSKAGQATFPQLWQSGNGNAEFSAEEIALFDRLLDRAYEESGIVTAAFAKTFYLGTQVLPEPAMKAIWAVYVWCRRTDEIVDAPRPEAVDPDAEMLSDLSEWEIRLERLFDRGEVVDVLDLPLLDCKVKYPSLPITPFSDMIRGMLMDIPGLGQERYDTWDELHLYCYRVAGTVGLMSMPIFGCAPGFTDEIAKEPALSLGVAFQITNILRDVGEDAEKRERVYLPQCDMERFGVTEQQIMEQRVDQNYINLMKFEIARARMYYARALRGVPMLRAESRLPVQLSLDAYGQILDKIEENGYDSLTKRAYVGKWEKLAGVPASWYRTLDIAKSLPLPGDWGKPSLEDYEKELEEILEKKWAEMSK
eukprot:CAMPEP_0113389772 /NCGR_PEP_ID=MMETSP0013_2-20120614/9805_1 /TAXON_ID=2843 ORGANISM="Skeletonema costatum, Strain 1716" /NCGR_SAMPLE_ID=MMETSP0013_2 /ASSEMBLY_ACC=CAM_ASM_000158 /LENGTH=547 /DNA_ID=CAMNT_0000272871 /DNA_START=201 /DNA_END=1844 /DNA_ORIENTATION=+ /assembly_acc=CAM_ASM_000158